jgi:uncharacterized protein with FMN-binding domain
VGNLALTFAVSAAMAHWTGGAGPVAPELPILIDRTAIGNAAVMTVAHTDGTFTGPAINAYWGEVQVQAVVKSGQIASLTVLKYPSDRRESLRISQQALPLLRNEVVKAQAARVNIITGATLTSEAFIRSLEGALGQAGGAVPPTPNGRTGGGQDNSLRI